MYYIYFSYVLLLSLLMLVDCFLKKRPKWWAAMVLFAPVTTPYFIFKSRKTEGMILFMVFLMTFSAVAGGEFYLWARWQDKNKYAHLPPITRQVMRLSDTLKKTTYELDQGLIRLEHLSKVESRIKELERTINFIGELRMTIARNQNAIERLIAYTTDYKSYFVKKDLEWIYHIRQFYTNRHVRRHYESLARYLNNFEALLKYTYENFYDIADLKTPENLKNYDEYYLRYRRAVDSHNAFNVQRIEFQNLFLTKYPAIKDYLPGERQTDTFRLWE